MKSNDRSWERLTAAARLAPSEPDVPAPYGFAARVARLAMEGPARPPSFVDFVSLHLSLRALGATALLAAVALGACFPTLVKMFSDAPVAASAQAAPAVNPASTPASTEPASEVPAAPEDDSVAEVVGLV